MVVMADGQRISSKGPGLGVKLARRQLHQSKLCTRHLPRASVFLPFKMEIKDLRHNIHLFHKYLLNTNHVSGIGYSNEPNKVPLMCLPGGDLLLR